MILETARITRKYWLLLLAFLTLGSVFGQQPVGQWVSSYTETKGKDVQALQSLQQHAPKEVAAAVWQYVNDSTKKEFEYTVYLIRTLEKKHSDKDARSSYVRSLMACALKQRSELTNLALTAMKAFEQPCFDAGVIDDLRLIISQRSTGRCDAIQLLGYTGTSGDVDFLNGLGKFTTLSKQEKYYVQLALVRLGDATATETLAMGLRDKTINDDVVTNLLPDLIYTHNKKIYGLLLKELMNDTPACYSANNDSEEKILCAYRILEQMSNEIVGFPVKATKYGELEGDYKEALITARKWVLDGNIEYSIDNTNF
jgi:hypothetical protein